ncbi:hypothetical protein A2982_02030 [candidate division WWE3 bacterium RIFCSPLOWO2_01_FULL_39_13]|uniref:PIN domain-containing protein n=1 Tax=candidate division WWE3 bacterium RIFCSPLOWO2_01_FULL_39_13 TaxID=1802624 RepID=A0A1F4V326_UNCKA|nr:MAG: hypothetical protein A2982_02030 [candidate division WWE3 bacterium RIFCSPLOWO2_01_FULL_39_13]
MANKKQSTQQKIKKIYIDTALYIYILNQDNGFSYVSSKIFNYCEENKITINASTIILTELLQHSKIQSDSSKKTNIKRIFLSTPNLQIIGVDITIAEYSAILAATYNLRVPDSVHLATAILSECEAFVTNDKKLKRVKEIDCILMDKFLK